MKGFRKLFLVVLTFLTLTSFRSFGQQFYTGLTLEGKIDKYPIVMELVVWGDGPSIVSGNYYYTSKGSNNRIILSDDLNDVNGQGYYPVLEESVNGKVTGTFHASYWDMRTMQGTWISANGSKQLPFTLRVVKSEDRSRMGETVYNGNSRKVSSGMGEYDYAYTISYSEKFFKSKSKGKINLPNGDVLLYQFIYECDFLPEYYMKFTLGNGKNITSQYTIVLVKSLDDVEGYVGTDEERYIDMRISYLGFDPESSNEMILLIRRK